MLPDGTGFLAARACRSSPTPRRGSCGACTATTRSSRSACSATGPGMQPFTAHDDLRALVITREQAGGVMSSTSGAVLIGEL